MTLELSPEIEQALARESEALGISPTELSVRVLAEFASRPRSSEVPTPKSRWTIEDPLKNMVVRNPNYALTDPYTVDWQAIKAEGRRY